MINIVYAANGAELPVYPAPGPGTKINLNNTTIGQIVTQLLPYVYVAAGMLMMAMIIIGGISLMTAAGDQNQTAAGYGKIKAGIIGFLIIFVSYFVFQLVGMLLGVNILEINN